MTLQQVFTKKRVIPKGWVVCIECDTLHREDTGPISSGPGRCTTCGVLLDVPLPPSMLERPGVELSEPEPSEESNP